MENPVVQVENAPTVVKAGLKKEEAEELQKKLEAGKRGDLRLSDLLFILGPVEALDVGVSL